MKINISGLSGRRRKLKKIQKHGTLVIKPKILKKFLINFFK